MNGQVFLVESSSTTKAIEELNVGELGIYAMDTMEQRVVNASPAIKADFFNIAVGKRSGGAWASREIEKPKHRNLQLRKFAYREPVKQVQVVTTDCLGDSQYDEVTIKFVTNGDFSGAGIDNMTQSFSVVGKHKSQKELWDKLAEAIDSDIIFSAVSTDGGLVVTSQLGIRTDITVDFTKDLSNTCHPCDCCSSKVEQVNEGDLGSGTYDQIMARVHEWLIWTGTGHQMNALIDTNPLTDFVVPKDIKATTYYVKWSNVDQPDDSHTAAAFNVYQEIMVVFPEGVDATYLEQTVEALVGKSFEEINFN
jgi:hypothetical protein